MAKHVQFGAYKINTAPEDIIVQPVEVAQKAFDEHMRHVVPHQLPDAPKEMQMKRKRWLDKKFVLMTSLEMAIHTSKLGWRKV